MMLTERDLQIADALTIRVQLLDFRQLAMIWWERNETSARRRLATLVTAGVLERTIANASRTGSGCVLAWTPGDRTPDFRELGERLRGRWRMPAKPVELFSATPFTANLFGSDIGRFTSIEERNRQLRLSQAFVNCATTRRIEVPQWHLRSHGNREESGHGRPDVVISDSLGKSVHAIGMASTSCRRMEELHAFCVGQELPYELW